jgi:outer membrane immunogenic protein
MFRKLLLSTVALVSGTAFAADLPSRLAPPVYVPPPPIFSWTGVYVGVDVGANLARSAVGIPLYQARGLSPFDINDSAVSVGGKIGFNYQVASFVFGLEGAGAAVFNSGSNLTGFNATELYQVKQDATGDVVGKAGYALDRALIYAKGGVAFANLNNLQFIPTTGLPVLSSFRTGWTVGAGIDYAITNNLILGVDYAYSDFGTGNYFYRGTVNSNVRYTTNAVNVSLSYKFDWFAAPAPVIAKY